MVHSDRMGRHTQEQVEVKEVREREKGGAEGEGEEKMEGGRCEFVQ